MTRVAFFIAALLFSINCYGQSKMDTDMTAYINNKRYIALADTAHLPKSIMPYYPVITGYLSRLFKSDEIYISSIQDDSYSLDLTVYGLSGIKLEKHVADREKRENDSLRTNGKDSGTLVINGQKEKIKIFRLDQVTGNLSGKDGHFHLDKKTGSITYKLWQ